MSGDGLLDLASTVHVHVIGIGGAGMSAIAEVLATMGHRPATEGRHIEFYLKFGDEKGKLALKDETGHNLRLLGVEMDNFLAVQQRCRGRGRLASEPFGPRQPRADTLLAYLLLVVQLLQRLQLLRLVTVSRVRVAVRVSLR